MHKSKLITFVLVGMSLSIAGCASDDHPPKAKPITAAQSAIEEARANADYRLYAFKGRRMTIPGLSNEQMVQAKNICGTKLMEGTGDVLKTKQDREKRKLKYKFASEYNQLMFEICMNQT